MQQQPSTPYSMYLGGGTLTAQDIAFLNGYTLGSLEYQYRYQRRPLVQSDIETYVQTNYARLEKPSPYDLGRLLGFIGALHGASTFVTVAPCSFLSSGMLSQCTERGQ